MTQLDLALRIEHIVDVDGARQTKTQITKQKVIPSWQKNASITDPQTDGWTDRRTRTD